MSIVTLFGTPARQGLARGGRTNSGRFVTEDPIKALRVTTCSIEATQEPLITRRRSRPYPVSLPAPASDVLGTFRAESGPIPYRLGHPAGNYLASKYK